MDINSPRIIDAVMEIILPDTGPIWSVGITSDPDKCRKHHNPREWHQWEADSLAAALLVEEYFAYTKLTGYGLGCPRAGLRVFVYLSW